MIENDYEFLCPYCNAEISVRLDATAGDKQEFIQDCPFAQTMKNFILKFFIVLRSVLITLEK
jgi:hypothetical protein